MSSSANSHLVVLGIPFPDAHRARFTPHFSSITHFPSAKDADADALAHADVLYGQAHTLRGIGQIPRARFIQLSNAGADDVLDKLFWKEDPAAREVVMTTVAGIHMAPISQYFIMAVFALYHALQAQIVIGQVEKRWGTADEVGGGRMFVQELHGKTVGVLGYGHIGRECARLSRAFGARVVVANSSGKRKPQEGWIEKGTGDPDGSIPEAWYASSDTDSFASFLARTDVLLLALPATAATRHVLSATTLAHLRPHAVLVNVGRGDAIDADALLAALDAKALAGAALDVTSPEPLPAGHALFGRRDVLLTPHLSGRTVEYWERAVDVFEANLARWKAGEEVWNRVDFERGY